MNEPFDRFDALLDRLLDQHRGTSVASSDLAELERLIQSDPTLRGRYRARVRMEE